MPSPRRFVLPLSAMTRWCTARARSTAACRAMPGRSSPTLRAYFAFMWTHPGKKLLFMGGEIGQPREWNHDGEVDWQLLDDPGHAGHAARWSRDLNRALSRRAGAARRPMPTRTAFAGWSATMRTTASLPMRARAGETPLVVVRQHDAGAAARLPHRRAARRRAGAKCSTPMPRSMAAAMSAMPARCTTEAAASHGRAQSLALTLPPLAALVLEREG